MIRGRWLLALLAASCGSSAWALPTTATICDVKSDLSNIVMSRTKNANPGPFAIFGTGSTYTPGQPMNITFAGGNFTGLLIYATDITNTARYGTITSAPAGFYAMPASECPPAASRISHNSSLAPVVTAAVFGWTAPPTNVGTIYFAAYVLSGTRGSTATQQFYRILPSDSAATLTLTAANSAPTISATAVTQRAGDAAASHAVATVGDLDQPASTLTVSVNGGSTSTVNGVTLSGLSIDNGGAVSATVGAACNASSAAFTLRVTDNQNAFKESTVNVTVDPNLPPALAYPATAAVFGQAQIVAPSSGPTDSGSIASVTLQSAGTYAGGVTVDGAGVASLGAATPVGAHTITVAATDNCGATGAGDIAVNVTRAATGLAISDTTDPSVNGAGVAVSQVLSVVPPGAGAPSGNIAVTGTGTTGCTIALPGTDCTLTFTASGAQTLQATYAGDTNFDQSSAAPISHTVSPGANLSVTNDNGRASLVTGDAVDYLIEVRNAGPDAVSGARLLDPVPAGLAGVTWTCTAMAPASCATTSGAGGIDVNVALGAGQGLDYVVSGTVAAAAGATVTSSASIAVPAGTSETVPADNAASDSDPVLAVGIFGDGFEN